MGSQFSEILLNKLKDLIFDIDEKISLEEQAKDIERLNEVIEKIGDSCISETEKSLYQEEKTAIENRIVQRMEKSSEREFVTKLSQPGEIEAFAQYINE